MLMNTEKFKKRLAIFQNESCIKDAIHVTLVCGNGYKQNKYSGIIQNIILGDDLFDKS